MMVLRCTKKAAVVAAAFFADKGFTLSKCPKALIDLSRKVAGFLGQSPKSRLARREIPLIRPKSGAHAAHPLLL